MPLTLPAAPSAPTLTNPATFEADCSAFLAWMASLGTAMAGKALLTTDILGTVSQSGGVPTGKLMERNSNANGEYERYANGLQICRGEIASMARASSDGFFGSWSFPAAFATTPYGNVALSRTPEDYSLIERVNLGLVTVSTNATALSCAVLRGAGAPAVATGAAINKTSVVAIGRWF
ncbi:hypothetical protein [Rhodobacter sp. NSM]|uniref:hypothetical protein n=1 Tax=Rhodobacter sp. NSM TaxID=3457501 RepID=UPI003FCFA508